MVPPKPGVPPLMFTTPLLATVSGPVMVPPVQSIMAKAFDEDTDTVPELIMT